MSKTRESKPKRSALVVKCREESDREIDPEKEHQRSKKMKKKTSAAKAGRCCCLLVHVSKWQGKNEEGIATLKSHVFQLMKKIFDPDPYAPKKYGFSRFMSY
jgi:hypothetical protein